MEVPKQGKDKQTRITVMDAGILLKPGVDDMIADLDSIVLGNMAVAAGSSLKLSAMLEQYYKDDDKTQAQARALKRPCSARRFHYFVAQATPTLPALNTAIVEGVELNVTLDRGETIEMLKPFLTDMADDLLKHPFIYSASRMITAAGQDLFDQFCAHFADFLIEGLRTGDVNWPPAQWT